MTWKNISSVNKIEGTQTGLIKRIVINLQVVDHFYSYLFVKIRRFKLNHLSHILHGCINRRQEACNRDVTRVLGGIGGSERLESESVWVIQYHRQTICMYELLLGMYACTGVSGTYPFLLNNDCQFSRTTIGARIP